MESVHRPFLAAALAAAVLVACSPVPPADHPGRAEAAAPRAAAPPGGEARDAPEAQPSGAVPAAAPAPLPTAEERAAGLATLRAARAQAAAGNVTGALRAYDDAARALPAFRDWAQVLAADAARQAGDASEVARRIGGVAPGSAAEWGWRVHARTLRDAGDLAGALAVATRAAAALPEGPAAAAARAEAGDLRQRQGDHAGALREYREAMRMAPEGPDGLRAARAAHDLPALAAEDHLAVGRTLLRHGGVDRGIPALERYLASGAGTVEERAAVRLQAGRVLFNARRYADAIRHLNAAAGTHGEASFLLGRALFRGGQRDAGIARFRATAEQYPRDPAAADALTTLGDLADADGHATRAREHYRTSVATGVHTQATADAAVRGATVALRQGNARAAAADLEAYLAGRPRDRLSAPALYWAGRAHHAAGAADAAARRYRQALEADPYSYYGVRAADQLGTTLRAVALPAAPRLDPAAAAEVEGAFFRMDLLRELGLTAEADFELARLRDGAQGDPARLTAVAQGMIPRGQPIAAALLAVRVQREAGAWNEPLLRVAYQFPYRDLIVRESRRQGLDPYVVAGLIRQESLFNANAVSPAGAIGLMQVMPETGRGLARRVGITGYTPAMLRDPEVNVRMGTVFLADQMRRWGGREPDVFAAYNAGPGRVVRWREFPEHRDEDLFAERIPFAETRDYVKKVRANARIYRALYGDG